MSFFKLKGLLGLLLSNMFFLNLVIIEEADPSWLLFIQRVILTLMSVGLTAYVTYRITMYKSIKDKREKQIEDLRVTKIYLYMWGRQIKGAYDLYKSAKQYCYDKEVKLTETLDKDGNFRKYYISTSSLVKFEKIPHEVIRTIAKYENHKVQGGKDISEIIHHMDNVLTYGARSYNRVIEQAKENKASHIEFKKNFKRNFEQGDFNQRMKGNLETFKTINYLFEEIVKDLKSIDSSE